MLSFRDAFSVRRAIQHGWAAVERAPGALLLGATILLVTEGGGGPNNFDDEDSSTPAGSSDPSEAFALWSAQLRELETTLQTTEGLILAGTMLGCGCALIALFWLLDSYIRPGYLQAHQHVLLGHQTAMKDLFSRSDQFVPMAIWTGLKALVMTGVSSLVLIPPVALTAAGLYYGEPIAIAAGLAVVMLAGLPILTFVSLGLALGPHALVLEGLRPLEALERSWELASGNRLVLLRFFMLTGLLHMLSLVLCCPGLIFSRAVIDFGETEAFLLATRTDTPQSPFITELGL